MLGGLYGKGGGGVFQLPHLWRQENDLAPGDVGDAHQGSRRSVGGRSRPMADAVQISVSWSSVKTTLDLRDDLLSKAKQQAAKERISLTRMIEEGLTLRLRRSRDGRRQLKPLPVSRRKGGLRRGIDGRSNKSLFDAAD